MSVSLYRTRADILNDMLSQLQGYIPDVFIGEDGVLFIIFSINAGQFENVFMANQMLLQDMFIQTASTSALRLHGEQFGLFMHEGTRSTGQLTFEGAGGTYIPISTEAAYDPGSGLEDVLFVVNIDGTIPDPGDPDAPDVIIGAAGVLNDTYEYIVTFLTATGETLPSPPSESITPSSQQVTLQNIPVGGPGVTAKRIYRDKAGAGVYRMVAEITNATTTYTDNIADGTVAANSLAPSVDTAHRITLDAEAREPGIQGNTIIGSVTTITDAPGEVTAVTNPVAFVGGTDPEDSENFRYRLLQHVRNAQTGSPDDLKSWAEDIPGVETASVFPNDNLGVATPGHVTVRITASGGAVPTTAVLDAVYTDLASRDLANITLHVASFNPVVTNVTVDITVEPGFAVGDISPSVQQAVADYINGLEVGETLYVSGIIAAVKPLPGVLDVVVTVPSSNQTTAATDKRVPGTITVI